MSIILKSQINRVITHPVKFIITIISVALGIMIISICMNINFKLEYLISNKSKNTIINVMSGTQRGSDYITESDAPYNDAILKNLQIDFPDIIGLTKISWARSTFLYNDELYKTGHAIHTDSTFLKTLNIDLLSGSNFMDESRENEVLISTDVASIIFEDVNPIGEVFLLRNSIWNNETKTEEITFDSYNIIGVYKSSDTVTKMMTGIPDIIFNSLPEEELGYMTMRVDTKSPEVFKSSIKQYLKNELGDDKDVIIWNGSIKNPYDESGWFKEITKMMILFFSILGGVTLVVSSFSVFSMVMISVTERGREIGLKRALGCTKISIIKMFMLESAIFILIGSIPGVFLAYLFFPVVLDSTLPSITGGSLDLSNSVTKNMEFIPIIISVGITMFMGAVVGIFPSITSVSVRPIESIREG